MKGFNYKTVVETLRNRETEFGEIIDQLKKLIIRIRKLGAF